MAVIQHDIFWENPEKNLQQVSNIIRNAEYADVFVLPEMFNTGFSNNINDMSEDINGNTINTLKNIAKEKNAAICTSIILSDHNKFYNSFLFNYYFHLAKGFISFHFSSFYGIFNRCRYF